MWDRAFEHVRDGQNETLRRTQIHKISNETLAQVSITFTVGHNMFQRRQHPWEPLWNSRGSGLWNSAIISPMGKAWASTPGLGVPTQTCKGRWALRTDSTAARSSFKHKAVALGINTEARTWQKVKTDRRHRVWRLYKFFPSRSRDENSSLYSNSRPCGFFSWSLGSLARCLTMFATVQSLVLGNASLCMLPWCFCCFVFLLFWFFFLHWSPSVFSLNSFLGGRYFSFLT